MMAGSGKHTHGRAHDEEHSSAGHCCAHDHSHERGHEHEEEDNPESAAVPQGAREETFRVSGMDCSEEVAAIERAVKPLAGVLGVRAKIVASTVTIYHDGTVQSPALVAALNSSGVKVET